jgi:hypothetical protein
MKNHMNTPITLLAVALSLTGLTVSAGDRTTATDVQTVNLSVPDCSLPLSRIGLYDSDAPEVTTGELNSQDYWWTKFDAMMLEIALKQRQPEGRIGIDLAIALRRIDDLQKKYPKHDEIKKWRARFEEVQSKIDPNANRGDSFTTECPWDESNFAQLWVNFHWAKVAADQKDWTTAVSCLQNVEQNYEIMLAPDRMKDYPADLRKWVIDSKPEADKLYATAKAKTGG